MTLPRCLDLFCGAGGAAKGYHDAGFEVVGVDITPQRNYPYEFHQADALAVLARLVSGKKWKGYVLSDFDLIHASPPCQAWTEAARLQGLVHPKLIKPVRKMLKQSNSLYIIENVVGAPLRDPIMLCGTMFGLQQYRHRLFETSFWMWKPNHPEHVHRQTKMGRPVKPGEFMHVVGNFSDVTLARQVMGIPWMTRNELSEAIPPAYTRFIGRRALRRLKEEGVA